MATTDCIFCKIPQDDTSDSVIYRDERVYVIRDINPKAPVHLLIIPLQHLGSLASSWVGDAYHRVCSLAHQCHGAIGFTKEHDLQLYSRRAKAQEIAYGDPAFHRELLAQALNI